MEIGEEWEFGRLYLQMDPDWQSWARICDLFYRKDVA
jgi:hypothetical protein